MKQLFTLKIVDRFSWLFRLLGVDYRKLRLIVGFKLTMDTRRVPTIIGNQARKKDPIITPFFDVTVVICIFRSFINPVFIV